jgi:hypothetical protein
MNTIEHNFNRLQKTAGGMSRLWHWLTEGRFGILSAERPEYTPKENKERTRELKKLLVDAGYGFYPAEGFWAGIPEASMFVPLIDKAQLLDFGAKYDQEAIIFGESGESGVYSCQESNFGKSMYGDPINVKDNFAILSPEEKDKLEEEKAEVGFTRVKKDRDTFTLDPEIKEWRENRREGSSMNFLVISERAYSRPPMGGFNKVVTASSVEDDTLNYLGGSINLDAIMAVLPMGKGLLDDTDFNSTVHRSY